MINPRNLVCLLFIVVMSLLSGCSDNRGGQDRMQAASDLSMEPIKVELSWSPKELSVNQKATFEAVVTQDGKPVDDAKEVIFEIVNKNDKTKKLELPGNAAGEGTYKAEVTLGEEGQFTVTSHVSARTQHSMPSKELSVQP